jgi:tetratricopeptide (TPR) repeat protein
MARIFRHCSLFVLLLPLLVCAQRSPQVGTTGPGFGFSVRLRFHLGNSQPLVGPLRIDLYSGIGLLLARTIITDVSTVITFDVPGAGNYEIRASGEDVEPGTYPFSILPYDTAHVENIVLKPARRASVQSAASPAEFLDARVPGKARKELEKGTAAAGRQKWEQARAHYEAATRAYANYAAAYYRLALVYLKLDQKNMAREAFQKLVELRPENTWACVQLARLDSVEKRFDAAEQLLQKVVAAQPQNAEALFLLANAQRELGKNSEAVVTARQAQALPHRSYETVHLVCGMALERQGQPQQAAEEYRTFLTEAPGSPLVPGVRAAVDLLSQAQKQTAKASDIAPAIGRELATIQPIAPTAVDQPWAPEHVDFITPPVQNVACALNDVLKRTGARVQTLVNDLQQFTANEAIEHSEFDGSMWRQQQTKSFEYVAEIQRHPSGALAVQEWRNGLANILGGVPIKLLTTGMAAFALVFHPNYIGNFAVNCEGKATVQGQPAWQIYFAQRPEITSNFRAYWVAGKHYPIKLKGRAWISADTYDVLRIETDLAEPIQDLLQREHITVNYRVVDFAKKHEQLRLPETAEIYMVFRGHRYRDRHIFSNYQLFSVETTEQTHVPAEAEVAQD